MWQYISKKHWLIFLLLCLALVSSSLFFYHQPTKAATYCSCRNECNPSNPHRCSSNSVLECNKSCNKNEYQEYYGWCAVQDCATTGQVCQDGACTGTASCVKTCTTGPGCRTASLTNGQTTSANCCGSGTCYECKSGYTWANNVCKTNCTDTCASLGLSCGMHTVCSASTNCGTCTSPSICCANACKTPACSSNADCNDGNSCTTDVCNSPNSCTASCSHNTINSCTNSDGCCPSTCTSATDNDCTATPDTISPTVNAFTAVVSGTNVNINYTVADTGGSHLARVEVWRAPDNAGSPGTWSEVVNLKQTITTQNLNSYTHAVTDTPGTGTWWYGIHVVDQANNVGKEASPIKAAITSTARNLYVATNGNDSVSYVNNSINNPWLTPQHAWNTAQAGDVVNFRAGTYDIATMIDTNNTGNNGTSGSWITFQAYAGELVTIRATAPMGIMLQLAKNYQRVKNIKFDANGNAARGFGIGWYDSNTTVTGFEADNVTVTNWATGDNPCAFYIGSSYDAVRATNITIRNSTIVGASDATGLNQNYSGIMVFGADDFHLVNNDISQVRHGIYLKHSSINYSDHGDTVENNYIHNLHPSGGNGNASINVNTNYTTISNNILSTYISLGEDAQSGGSLNGNYCTINHNTVANSISFTNEGGSSYNIVINNIFTARTTSGMSNIWDYNMYGNGAAIGTHDLANRTPIFAGGSSPATIAGFALTSSSPGYQTGSNGKNMGADVSLVGINAGN